MASPASLRHLARGRTRRGQRESLGLARVAPDAGARQAEEAHIRRCQGALRLDTEAVFTGWSSPVRSRGTGRGAGDGAAMHGFGRVARIAHREQSALLLEGDRVGGRPFPAGLAPMGAASVGTLGDERPLLRVGELDGTGLASDDRSHTGGDEESLKRRAPSRYAPHSMRRASPSAASKPFHAWIGHKRRGRWCRMRPISARSPPEPQRPPSEQKVP